MLKTGWKIKGEGMDHYLEIRVQPDAEIRENELLNKLYSKFHKALCDLKATDIGVSFPEYQIKLGRTLRIHGTAARLAELQQLNWLGGLSGYCKIAEIQTIPTEVQYRTVSRVQATMSNAKLNRLLKRGTATENVVKQYKAKMFSQRLAKRFGGRLDNPYLELNSSSNGHKHRRYLSFGNLQAEPRAGVFDFFGLSKTATIPVF